MLAVSHLWLRTAPMSGEEGPSPVRSFLEPLNLVPYRALLKEQGFDDPDDFGNMSASDVDTMAAALSAGGMKPGHVLKLSRKINELRKPAGEPSTPPAVPAGSAAPSAQSLTAAAAALLGAATSTSATGAHPAKVETWRASCGGNLLFGRSNPTLVLTPYQKEVRSHTGTALTRPTSDSVGALSHHHHHHPRDRAQMNKAADKMLSEQPSTHAGLVSFRGSGVQLQPLIEACKVLVAGEYDFAKKKGSRAGGLAGAAGYRGGPSEGPPISDDSSPQLTATTLPGSAPHRGCWQLEAAAAGIGMGCPRADVPGVDVPGVGTHPATGRPGVGPGLGLIWAPRGPGTAFTTL